MDDEQTPQNNTDSEPPAQNFKPIVDKPKKHDKKGLLVIILLAVLFAGAGALGYLAYQKADEAKKLSAQNTELKEEISTKDARIAELQPAGSGAAAASCGGGSAYAAEVGKFEATLDDPYAIVRNLDAGFEGGPATNLSVVACLEDEINVFDNPPQNEVTILANPSSTAADLRSSYESRAGSTLTADGTVTIDDVTADKYALSGLFETTVIFFDNDGIGYQIELADTNDTTNAILTDLTADWSFTP